MLCYQGLGRCGRRRARTRALHAIQGGRVLAGDHGTVPAAARARQQRAAADPRASRCRLASGFRGSFFHEIRATPRQAMNILAVVFERRVVAVMTLSLLLFTAGAAVAQPGPAFTDVTAAAGIRFRHNNGAFGKKLLPETLGSGCAFLDFDNDGWQDILLINSMNWPGAERRRRAFRRSTATTTTARSPTSRAGRPGCRAVRHAASRPPTTTTTATPTSTSPRSDRIGCSGIWGTAGSPTSRPRAGVGDPGFSTSAMWFDYDRDGRLDLFVAQLRRVVDREGSLLHARRQDQVVLHAGVVQGPELVALPQQGRRHLRGRHRARPACTIPTAKALGVALIDYDDDGRPDLFVANDTQPNRLYRNKGNGTFTDVGDDGGRRVQRGRRRARRHGRRRRRLRRLRPPEPRHRQLLERDDGALLATRGTACSSTRRRPRRSARRRC